VATDANQQGRGTGGLGPRAAAWLAWSVWALCGTLVVLTARLHNLTPEIPGRGWLTPASLLIGVLWLAYGGRSRRLSSTKEPHRMDFLRGRDRVLDHHLPPGMHRPARFASVRCPLRAPQCCRRKALRFRSHRRLEGPGWGGKLPRETRKPKKLWLWFSGDGEPDLDLLWRAYVRRFDLEHAIRFLKQTLGWTAPRVRHPEQAERWTWLVLAAYAQLRLARGVVADRRLPWERPRICENVLSRGRQDDMPHGHFFDLNGSYDERLGILGVTDDGLDNFYSLVFPTLAPQDWEQSGERWNSRGRFAASYLALVGGAPPKISALRKRIIRMPATMRNATTDKRLTAKHSSFG